MVRGESFGASEEATLPNHQCESRPCATSLILPNMTQIWRPIGTVTRDPLAVSDARSIPDSDLVYVPVRFPDHDTEAVEVRPPTNSPHKWYFKDKQQTDDVLFFKQVDSCQKPGVPRRVPHCAFKDTELPEGAGELRMSVELRAFVFYDEE
jgi:hypothetical protein